MNKSALLVFIFVFCAISFGCAQNVSLQEKLTQNDEKIDKIISGLSLEEKVAMLHGKTIMSSEGIPRLAIAPIHYADGPFGVREEVGEGFRPMKWDTDSATYFPTGSALAATWSEELAYDYGAAIGTEARRRGKDVMLGPAINIQRLPVGGRTYEYFSEDPALNSALAVGYVKGMQEAGTAACVKHYALNNQETNRGTVNVIIDERPMRELYLKAFEAAVVEGGAMSIMPAYNKVNGFYGSENDLLNNQILRGEWGFRGFTVSDWGGTHSTVDAAVGGLDVQMPGAEFFGQALVDSVRAGAVDESVIDEKVKNILRVRFAIAAVPESEANTVKISQAEQQKTAYDVAAKSIVLLKNEGSRLPLDISKIKKIAVIGRNATASTAAGGMGAGVKAPYEVTPLQGIIDKVGSGVEVLYAPAYKNYLGFFGKWMMQKDGSVAEEIDEAPDAALLKEALDVAAGADIVLFFAGTNKFIESEGVDRTDIMLPVGQDQIIAEIAKVNSNIVTVIISGGPVDLNVVDKYSPAIVEGWWNGLEGGHALADVLLGTISPSGKLPFTFPVKLEDSPAYALGNFPQKEDVQGDIFGTQYRKDIKGQKDAAGGERPAGVFGGAGAEMRAAASIPAGPNAFYSEGMLVGYRWFDTKKVPVMYPFGHGLSYVDFKYDNIRTNKSEYLQDDVISVSFDLSNTGKMTADEVAQLYVHRLSSDIEWPAKELKAFKRVTLQPGETKTVTLQIPVSALRYWNESTHAWTPDPCRLELLLGSSSADIRLKAVIKQ